MARDLNEIEQIELINKVLNLEELTEEEISFMVFDSLYLIPNVSLESNEYYEKTRWSIPVSTVIKIDDRYFNFNWYRGATEYQDHQYDTEYFEVRPKEVKKIVYERV